VAGGGDKYRAYHPDAPTGQGGEGGGTLGDEAMGGSWIRVTGQPQGGRSQTLARGRHSQDESCSGVSPRAWPGGMEYFFARAG